MTDYGRIMREIEAEREDVVNKPKHYNQAGIECIDAIEAALSAEELQGYYKGTSSNTHGESSTKTKTKTCEKPTGILHDC